MPDGTNTPALQPQDLPEIVVRELSADDNRPALSSADEDGRTLFDAPGSDDGTVVAVFPQERFECWRSQALAHIHSADKRVYLAQVASGPYAAPNGLPATSPLLVTTQIEGTLFTPPYHGWVELRILGEVKDEQVIAPLFRPRPNSSVKLLQLEETKKALKCDGDLRLGRAVGYPDLFVGLQSTEKHHMPRHTLVVGTTGAGKSTCMAGLIEKLSAAGFCVLVIDVEGEYTTINEPADSNKILPALQNVSLAPAGLADTFLLVPTNTTTANPRHPHTRRFCLDFANISPHVAVELLQGNEAQTDRFITAYDAAGDLLTQLWPKAERDKHMADLQTWDDQETGYPGLRLRGDVVGGTPDGLAPAPYVRESRRIRAEFTVLEQHIAHPLRPDGPELFRDSVGIGCYRIDLHPRVSGAGYLDLGCWPFQIPLGAMIPVRVENLLPGGKNLGVTHITNGAFRLHPVEWNVGEAAGILAAFCLERKIMPRAVRNRPELLEAFQALLRREGVELSWPRLTPL